MKVRQGPARAVLVSSLVSVLASAVVVGAAASAATATPPYEPDASAAGTITFYDASGAAVTSGSASALVGYAVGSAALTSTANKASLYGYLPKSTQAPGQFSGELLSGPSTYPIASAPAAVSGSSNPAVKPVAGDLTFADLAKDFPNTATDAYQGLYQIRIKTTDTKYLVADIQITGGTWTEVYPTAGTGPSPTPTPTPDVAPTLNASPLAIVAGRTSTVTVKGAVGSSYQVFAAYRPSSSFRLSHQGVIGSGGIDRFSVRPLNNVTYIAKHGTATSNRVGLAVRSAVTIAYTSRNHIARISGQVNPARNGQLVTVYTIVGKVRTKVGSTRVRGRSWTLTHNFRTSAGKKVTMYASTAADTLNASGQSPNIAPRL